MRRTYRVILEVDIEAELDTDDVNDPAWATIEEHLEIRDNWYVACDSEDDLDYTYVNHAEVDSYDVEWE